MTPEQVTEEFKSWLGVGFLHQGRSRERVDCAGLVVCALRDLSLLPYGFKDVEGYSRHPQEALKNILATVAAPTKEAIEGTLILIKWPHEKIPSHIGYFTGGTMIHCYSRAGKVVEHGYREPWIRLTDSVWKIQGVSYV